MFDYSLSRSSLNGVSKVDKAGIKDLNLLLGSRELKNIIIIDNKETGCFPQSQNLIPIKDYLGGSNDKELLSLNKYLNSFLDVIDVRLKIIEDF